MTHVYKVKAKTLIKVGDFPVELQEDVIFHSENDLLKYEKYLRIDLKNYEEKIGDEWIGLDVLKEKATKTKAELLIESLTKDSGRTVFTTAETLQLQEISFLEAKDEIDKLAEKITEFKKQYVLKRKDWLC